MDTTIEAFMRERETIYDLRLPSEDRIVLRLDGRNFSSMTDAHYKKPFDSHFHVCMLYAAQALMQDLHATLAYVGSDEITLVLPEDFMQFDRRVEKLLSLSAAITTAAFIQISGLLSPQFDCRILPFDKKEDIVACLAWRRDDVRRNALQTATYWALRHNNHTARQATKALNGISWEEKEALLYQYQDVAFTDIASCYQQGVCLIWETYQKAGLDPRTNTTAMAERRRVITQDPLPQGKAYNTWLQEIL
jgi:tRNA(His) guanylyltransferase